MSNHSDHTGQQQRADEAFRRPRYVPYPMMDLYPGEHPSARSLYQVVPGVPVHPTSSQERTTRSDIQTFPFSRVPTREVLTVPGVRATPVPSTYARPRTPGYSFAARQPQTPLPSQQLPSRPRLGTFSSPGSSNRSRGANTRGGPPPYWQHIGEPSIFCTPPRAMNDFPPVGRRASLPLPPIQHIFSSVGPQDEIVELPPLFASPSVFNHMRDADPATAVDAGVGPRSRSKSPDSRRSHGSGSVPEPARTHEEPSTPTPIQSAPPRVPRARQRDPSPKKTQPEPEVPDSSAELTEFVVVEAHTAKCDICNKRNSQGMTRCAECGWQTCNACTIKNHYFRSHQAGTALHVGPVDKKDLPTAASVKKAKQAAKRKREDPDYVPESERGSKKKRTAKSQVRATEYAFKPSSSSSLDGSPNEAGSAGLRETDAVVNAARNLYAMSLEAFEMDARAQASMMDIGWYHSVWVEVNKNKHRRDDDDETELMEMEEGEDNEGSSSPLDRCIPRLRQETLEIANEEAGIYVRNEKARKANASAVDVDEGSECECEPKNGKVKTRAQAYARKRSGR
ncbi:hypothetical protein P170DRAFT_470926 [Aspergillus steynii IBT 23096]|uniref:Uncharacterized protein n=1 Tax=Aspergillus steynii IBT 23096 TaxID=1392250 RepID=A0A2I2GRK7_9EURO|nr:uncharacterized protein P170DRAFT_470926 [Aspergillus steynii IBT 23096]PLB55515.1 hypothetical protein P170DRAFT_470926 [Aspergillus steynii IBT 23096]